ncbi:MAG: UDP-3-O-(3-hydroxymyristoyl)glucosamine N-acyltransferase [Rickettsiales bacterium]|nr:UDP-3-O-(3-hydroxymyristoyl)glucosamine N-acyltransferase [Rickettsiales bacterium]
MKINYKGFFIKKKEYVNILELSSKVNVVNISSLNPEDKIYCVETLAKATENDASFLSNIKYLPQLKETKAGFCFIQEQYQNAITNGITKPLIVNNPHYAYTVLLNEFFSVPLFEIQGGVSSKATISETARIGNNTEIQAGAIIFDNVVIGDNCKICANAVINHGCVIGNNNYIGANATISYTIMGDNNIIQNNVSLGHCGFGFAHNEGFNHKIPQIGLVKIGNNVEIGMGCSIARGALENTEIGDMAKIDCLTHIAHGVKVGMGCFLAGQVGIAGSTEIGVFCQIGGQTAINGHIKIGNFNEIAGRSGVVKSTDDGAKIGGFPAVNLKDWHRQMIMLNKLIKKGKNDE